MAPTAFTASAVCGSLDSCGLKSPDKAFSCLADDFLLLAVNENGELVFLANLILRIIGIIDCVHVVAGHLCSVASLGKAKLLAFAFTEGVHCLRSAHEYGVVSIGSILLNKLCGEESVLIAFLFLVGKNMDNLDLAVALCCQLFDFILEKDSVCCA